VHISDTYKDSNYNTLQGNILHYIMASTTEYQ